MFFFSFSHSLLVGMGLENVMGWKLIRQVGERYHAPLSVLHRGDLQGILLNAVRNQNITLRTNARLRCSRAAAHR